MFYNIERNPMKLSCVWCWLAMPLGAGFLRWVLACRTIKEEKTRERNYFLINLSFFSWYIWAEVNVRLVNLSHGKCEFDKYELLYSWSMVDLRVVNMLFGTNELATLSQPIIIVTLGDLQRETDAWHSDGSNSKGVGTLKIRTQSWDMMVYKLAFMLL